MNDRSSVEAELQRLEEKLLDPAVRGSKAEMDALLDDRFVEFASTGEVYTKDEIVEALRTAPATRRRIEGFKVTWLAADAALATFRLLRDSAPGQAPIRSIRSSIWTRSGGRWRMTFHQGTISEDGK
jgi:hypothetical protein